MASPETPSSLRASYRIDAITSGFVGALALAVSTYNVYLQREQIRAQVWPHLEWTYAEHYSEAYFDWKLENTGVGPAIVKGVAVKVDGKVAKNWDEALELTAEGDPALQGLLEGPDHRWLREGLAGRVLGPGVAIHPLRIEGAKPEYKDALRKATDRVSVEICFCSTLGECWMHPGQEPVRACPGAAAGFVFTD